MIMEYIYLNESSKILFDKTCYEQMRDELDQLIVLSSLFDYKIAIYTAEHFLSKPKLTIQTSIIISRKNKILHKLTFNRTHDCNKFTITLNFEYFSHIGPSNIEYISRSFIRLVQKIKEELNWE